MGARKAQEQIAVVFVLLAAQLDFARQAFAQRIREGVEFVEDGDDAGLLGEGWNWYREV